VVALTGTHTARKRKHEASEAKLDKAPECARAIAQSKKQRLSMATTEMVSAGAKKIGMKAVAATVVVVASAGKEKAPVASKKSVAPERPVKETTVPRQKKAPSSTADDKNGEGRAAATGEATARKKTDATETTKAASGKKKTGVIETKKAAAAAAASEERQGVSATTKKKTVAASGKKRTGAIETKKVVVSRKKKKTVPATAKKKIDVNETKRAVTTKRETVTAPVSAKTGTKGSAHGGRKKRRRNRRSRREQPPALAADDFAGDGGGDRRRWGSYLQMDAARKAPPYVGKTPDIVRRTKEHRRGDCKHTRRFQGDIAPVWFVDGGFGCDRDVQQYEWRMKHEYSPRAKFRRAFGGAEARALRDQATARIRVAPQTKPSANLDKALRALCSMLQITQWTAGAIPIGHEWRAALPKFVVHWFGPDPVCYGYDVKRLPTAYPVRHVFDCVLDGFTGSVASDE
jgi:predicted GIY-YIG superfamily endonuclease